MSTRAILGLWLSAVAAIAQFYPPLVRDNPPALAEIAAPPEVRRVLRRSCYDCHSNETRWPWYGYVAPFSWLVVGDVHDARSRMSFTAWPQAASPDVHCYFKRRILERVRNREMPPLRYRVLHPSAAVTEEEALLLQKWTTEECGEGGERRSSNPKPDSPWSVGGAGSTAPSTGILHGDPRQASLRFSRAR